MNVTRNMALLVLAVAGAGLWLWLRHSATLESVSTGKAVSSADVLKGVLTTTAAAETAATTQQAATTQTPAAAAAAQEEGVGNEPFTGQPLHDGVLLALQKAFNL